MDIASLGIAVDSRQVRRADSDLERLNKTGRQTEKQTDQLGRAFRRIAAPLAAYLSARQISQSADAWTNLNNRLRLVTDTSEELVSAQESVFSIAQRSRQPLQSTAELYQRIAQNQNELGVSSDELVSVVDTISKSLAISGTTAESANAALIQLGQGFAAGTLRGEELNSVLEQAPALAQAIARGLNVPVGKLRELGEQGELTARNIIDALLSQGDAVDQQFSRITATIDQASTRLGNSLTRVVGELDTATGASAGLAQEIIDLSAALDSGLFVDSALETFSIWSMTIDQTTAATAGLSNELQLLGDIGSESASLVGESFKNLPLNISNAIQVATIEITSLLDRLRVVTKGIAGIFSNIGDSQAQAAAFDEAFSGFQDISRIREESLQQIFNEREAILSTADAERTRREEERKNREEARKERDEAIAALRAGAGSVDLSGAGGKSSKATENLLKLYERTEQSLSEQVALFGEVGEAAQIRYAIESGALVGINDAQQRRLLSLAEELDAKQALADQQEQLTSLREASLTREEQLLAQLKNRLKEIAELVQEGTLTQQEGADLQARFEEQWKTAVDAAKNGADEMSVYAERAAQNMQDAFADFLFDPFDKGIDGLLNDFDRFLRQAAAQAASAEIFDYLKGLGSSSGGGGASGNFWGDVAGAFAGFFDDGGNIRRGQFGVVGERGPEIVTGPANVIGRQQTAQMMSSQSINVTQSFPNVRTEREAKQAGGASAREISRIANAGQRYA